MPDWIQRASCGLGPAASARATRRLDAHATTSSPDSEVRNSRTYGVLQLELRPHSYHWTFLPEAGRAFTDTGAQRCH